MDSATLVRRARTRAGLSQRELAARAQTSAAAVSLYETGQRIPRVDTLQRIMAAAGSTLVLDAFPDAELDQAANGAILVQVLELAEQFPYRPALELDGVVFAQLAR